MSPKPVLDQVNVVVSNMDATVAFYGRMGIDFTAGTPEWAGHHRSADGGEGLDLDLDSVVFARSWNEGWTGRRNNSGCVLVFRVETREEVDALHDEMVGAGYKVQQKPYDAFWGARFTVFEDPDGNAVGVMSPADPGLRGAPKPPG